MGRNVAHRSKQLQHRHEARAMTQNAPTITILFLMCVAYFPLAVALFSPRLRFGGTTSFLLSSSSLEVLASVPDDTDLTIRTDLLKRVDSVLDVVTAAEREIDKELILKNIDESHANDTELCAILNEGYRKREQEGSFITPPIPPTDAVTVNGEIIGVLTTEPLLNASSIQLLRECATNWWEVENGTSRFTYQRKGNKEVHLIDLCRNNSTLLAIIKETLYEKIYPLVEHLYLEPDDLTPFVYDSIIIRYNATEAGSQLGAGQPLHRDLGLVSVNIKLNNDFEGGGTLMDAQLENENGEIIQPIKPLDVGYAFIHESCQRHAGVGTKTGVRDILVLFLTAKAININEPAAPTAERAARLKKLNQGPDEIDPVMRATYYRMAIESLPTDGEAWHYLGMAIDAFSVNIESAAKVALDVLNYSACLIPNDARLYNNLALVLGRNKADPSLIEAAFQKSLDLHCRSEAVDCDVQSDIENTALNYGLFRANQDRFEEAADILRLIDLEPSETNDRTKLKDDTRRLLNFCEQQAALLQS